MDAAIDKATAHLIAQSNRIGLEFLLADLDLAQTFLNVAEVTVVEDARRRNRENAREAYQTVLRLLPRIVLSLEDREEFNRRLSALKSRLEELGYPVES
ncbi:MAG: hypothetical protein ABSE96_13645 [Terracidiphilus sp.]